MKKRVLSVTLLCLAMVVSLGACGGTEGTAASKEESAEKTTEVPVTDFSVTEALQEITEQLETVAETTAQPETTEGAEVSADVAADNIISDDTTINVEASPEPAESEPPTDLVDGMRPEFKEAMDSYEAFYDEYCDFMKKYSENSSDLTLILEYGEMLTRSAEMSEKFEKWNEDDLNDAELKYYLEVSNRVAQKLVDVAY